MCRHVFLEVIGANVTGVFCFGCDWRFVRVVIILRHWRARMQNSENTFWCAWLWPEHTASTKGSTKEVQAALQDGAEIDSIADSQGGRTALMVSLSEAEGGKAVWVRSGKRGSEEEERASKFRLRLTRRCTTSAHAFLSHSSGGMSVWQAQGSDTASE